MAESWEDDWEAEADGVGGLSLDDDAAKFAGEDEDDDVDDDWDTPAPQPKKVVEGKYAQRDKLDAMKGTAGTSLDPNDKAAVERAQQEGELRMMADMLGGAGQGNRLDTMVPKSNAEFDDYAQELVKTYGTVHKDAKQYRYFVKQVVKLLLEPMSKDGVKDIESCVAQVRSDLLKKEREAVAAAKKGTKKNLRMDDDINVGLDAVNYKDLGDADDDLDFM